MILEAFAGPGGISEALRMVSVAGFEVGAVSAGGGFGAAGVDGGCYSRVGRFGGEANRHGVNHLDKTVRSGKVSIMSKRNTQRVSLARLVELAAGVVALTLVVVIAAQVLGWHRPSAPVVSAPSGPSAEQLAFDAHQRAFEASLARLMASDACLSPEEWNRRQALIWARQYPARMIVQPVTAAGLPTWGLVVKPWSFSNVGGYVKGLCVR